MNRPLEAGDTCKVIGGLGRGKSPNLDLTVTVGNRIFGAYGMNHSELGPIHECIGEGVCQLTDGGTYIETGRADFADIWLERIPPLGLNPKEGIRELEEG